MGSVGGREVRWWQQRRTAWCAAVALLAGVVGWAWVRVDRELPAPTAIHEAELDPALQLRVLQPTPETWRGVGPMLGWPAKVPSGERAIRFDAARGRVCVERPGAEPRCQANPGVRWESGCGPDNGCLRGPGLWAVTDGFVANEWLDRDLWTRTIGLRVWRLTPDDRLEPVIDVALGEVRAVALDDAGGAVELAAIRPTGDPIVARCTFADQRCWGTDVAWPPVPVGA
jgi:hypothetical protein